MSNLKLDERALRRALQPAMKEVAKDAQRRIDTVFDRYTGKPVSQVEPALRRALEPTPVNPDRKQLKSWAQLISEGTRVEFTTG